MNVREGEETSFVLVSTGGRVVHTYDQAGEQRAREQARERRLRLFCITTVTTELEL